MNGNAEAARAWLQKAGSDLAAAELCLAAGQALDAACFHCQQAAEKSLKAWLVVHETAFPFVHDLSKLLTLCAQVNPEFERVREFLSAQLIIATVEEEASRGNRPSSLGSRPRSENYGPHQEDG